MGATQLKCNQNIHCNYYIGPIPDDHNKVFQKIIELMGHFKDRQIYIGITHHPCARFTSSYGSTLPLPPCMGFQNTIIEQNTDALIAEGGHQDKYQSMYLICHSDTAEEIERLEVEMIERTRAYIDTQNYSFTKVVNITPGGEHIDAISSHYFLYVCISKFIFLS